MEMRLAGVWDKQVRERVRQGLEGTGLMYASDTAGRVEVLLDRYASSWVLMSQQACEAADEYARTSRGAPPSTRSPDWFDMMTRLGRETGPSDRDG